MTDIAKNAKRIFNMGYSEIEFAESLMGCMNIHDRNSFAKWLDVVGETIKYSDRWRPMSEIPGKAGYYLTYDNLDRTVGKREYVVYPDGRGQWLTGYGTHWKPMGDPPTIGES